MLNRPEFAAVREEINKASTGFHRRDLEIDWVIRIALLAARAAAMECTKKVELWDDGTSFWLRKAIAELRAYAASIGEDVR